MLLGGDNSDLFAFFIAYKLIKINTVILPKNLKINKPQ